jgi:hypothetical protein
MKRKKPQIDSVAQSSRLHSQHNKKCTRGEGIYYDERKQKLHLTLTPSSQRILEEVATKMNLSKSEVVERILRKQTGAIEQFLN